MIYRQLLTLSTADEKVAIVMESFTSNNIAELCRRHGVFRKIRNRKN